MADTAQAVPDRWIGQLVAGRADQADPDAAGDRLASLVALLPRTGPEHGAKFLERAETRFMEEWLRKHGNVEAVALKALELLGGANDRESANMDGLLAPSQDWMNAFIAEAEKASGEELRARLASVLAGEVRSPGTFSRGTIRLMAELDDDMLQIFGEMLAWRVHDAIVTGERWKSGELFHFAVMAEDAGLVSGRVGATAKHFPLDERGVAVIAGKDWGLAIKGPPGASKSAEVLLLTRAGSQIATVLGPTDERDALVRLAGVLDKAGLDEIVVGKVSPGDEGSVSLVDLQMVWSSG